MWRCDRKKPRFGGAAKCLCLCYGETLFRESLGQCLVFGSDKGAVPVDGVRADGESIGRSFLVYRNHIKEVSYCGRQLLSTRAGRVIVNFHCTVLGFVRCFLTLFGSFQRFFRSLLGGLNSFFPLFPPPLQWRISGFLEQ